jgi:hypothetical protein
VLHVGGLDLLGAPGGLLLGQRDADALDAAVTRRVQQQSAPSAANVEQTILLGEVDLVEDEVELLLLSGLLRGASVRASALRTASRSAPLRAALRAMHTSVSVSLWKMPLV